ncbi:autotransporter assembly complex protein TamB [Pseudoalteromonas pernae]|uniref:autotransporter assembly complex protein TamB n=1 Tax=Pseudoalteromonas pernae TaxID=3118054 RepID=UPI003242A0A8
MKRVLLLSIKVLVGLVFTLAIIVSLLLFTAPGNKAIAALANKFVDGLEIALPQGRFLSNDPFDIRFSNPAISFQAQALQLDFTYFGCEGLCFDNLAAQKIDIVLGAKEPQQRPELAQKQPQKSLTLPDIRIQQISIVQLNAEVAGNKITVMHLDTAAAIESQTINIDKLSVNSVTAQLAQKVKENTKLEALPVLPPIEMALDINVRAPDIHIAQIHVLQGQQKQFIEGLQVGLTFADNALDIESLMLDYHLPNSDETAKLDTRAYFALFDNNELAVDADLQALGEHMQLQLSGSLNKLQFELVNQGQFSGVLSGNVQPRTQDWPFTLQAQQQLWQWQVNNRTMTLSNMTLSASGNTQDYELALQAQSQLGAFPQVDSSVLAKGDLHHINIVPAAIKARDSSAQVNAQISWQEGIHADFDARLAQLHSEYFTDKVTSNLSGNITGSFSVDAQKQWKVLITPSHIDGTLDGMELAFAADLKIDSTLETQINQLLIKQGLNVVSVQGQVNDNWQLDGKVNLSKETALLGAVKTQGEGSFSVRGDKRAPKLVLDAQLNDLSTQAATLSSANISLQGQYGDTIEYDLSAQVSGVEAKGQYIKELVFQSYGSNEVQQTSAKIVSELGAIETAMVSEISPNSKNVKLRVEQFDASIQEQEITLANATTFTLDLAKQVLGFDQTCLQGEAIDFCVAPSQLSKEAGEINAQLNHLYLDAFSPLIKAPVKVKGIADGHAKLHWQTGTKLIIDAAVNTNELEASLTQGQKQLRYPIEEFSIKLLSDTQVADASVVMRSSTLGNLNANVKVDDVMDQQTMQGQIILADVQLAKYGNLAPQLKALQGELKADIKISGKLQQPDISGQISATGIALEGEAVPVSLANTSVVATLDGDSVKVEGNLFTPDGGELSIDGSGVWLGANPTLEIALKGNKFTVVPQQSITVAFSPDMRISLDANKVVIDGEVEVPYARIKIKELPKGAVKVSADEIIVDAPARETKVPFAYSAKVKVKVTDDVYIDSFGLRSHVQGDVIITASNDSHPLAVGELKLVDGKYRAFGQDLIIRTGQVGFSGMLKKPYLNVRAIRNPDNTANGVIAGIELTGSVEQPELHVFSEPAMDKSQALSYVLNGQPLSDGDGNSDALLTQILLAQGMNRSEGVVSKVGEAFGLSDVALNSSGSGDDTKVEISGYIAPGIQVKYSVGVFESFSEIAVRYQVLQKLYIEVTSGLHQTLDVLYRFDVD